MASHSDFGEATTSTEVARALSREIYGKTVLITGVSPKSLGESLAFSIASQKPALMILASRTRSKIDAVAAKITEAFPDALIKAVSVDFSSQESVREAAKEVNKLADKIHILVNNGGSNGPRPPLYQRRNRIAVWDQSHWAISFYQLAYEQDPQSRKRSGSRHYAYRERNYLPPEEQPPSGLPRIIFKPGPVYGSFLSYGQSKTANILMSVYLMDRLSRQGILSYSVHPGTILTDMSRHLSKRDADRIGTSVTFWKSQDQGAATMLVAAFDPALNGLSGIYLGDCQIAEAAAFATDLNMADRLWHLSEDLVGQRFDLESKSRL